MSLLPSRPDAEPADDAGPRVIGVDSEDADEVLSALSSGTARQVLASLHDDPAPPSELADRVDTSLQNARHHLNSLQDADLVEVRETRYSSKGREMNVYAPAEDPMVVFVGREDAGEGLLEALRRFVPVVAVLALASLLVQSLATPTATNTAAGEIPRIGQSVGTAAGTTGLSPGVVFLAGGLLVVAGLLLVRRLE